MATWELMAAICALHWLLSEGFGELEVLLFVDNNAALGTLIRGSSRQADWNDLIGDLWLRVARAGVLLYSFYVPSHLNLADAPTRPRQKAAALEAIPVPCLATPTMLPTLSNRPRPSQALRHPLACEAHGSK